MSFKAIDVVRFVLFISLTIIILFLQIHWLAKAVCIVCVWFASGSIKDILYAQKTINIFRRQRQDDGTNPS